MRDLQKAMAVNCGISYAQCSGNAVDYFTSFLRSKMATTTNDFKGKLKAKTKSLELVIA